jgi:hypothetical protein
MNAFRKTLPLIVLGLMAAPAIAQQYLGYPSYAEWKAATYGVTLSNEHPSVVALPPQLRGGAETCDCWHEPDGSYTEIANNSIAANLGGGVAIASPASPQRVFLTRTM